MRIRIKTLALHNFKGIKDLAVDISERTEIRGANGTGKTTLADAWIWLLTGKNLADQTDSGRGSFQPMTTGRDGIIIRDIDHSAEAVIAKDGETITLGRSITQVWETINGEETPTLKGNTTKFFYNGVEIKKTKFQDLTADFVTETFRLCSVPGAFMAQDWKVQREMLLALSGQVTLESQAETDRDRAIIDGILKVGFDIWKKDITAKKKAVKTELSTLPGKIETANNLRPEPRDFAAIEARIAEIENANAAGTPVTDRIARLNAEKAELITEYQKATSKQQAELFELRKQQTDLENADKESARQWEQYRKDLLVEQARLIADNDLLKKNIATLRDTFRAKETEEYTQEASASFRCPLSPDVTCQNPILLANAKEAQERAMQKFYEDKETTLNAYNEKGKGWHQEMDKNTLRINAITAELNTVAPQAANTADIEEIKKKILAINATAPTAPDTTAIDNEINALLSGGEAEKRAEAESRRELADLREKLADRKAIEKADEEIMRIQTRQSELQRQLGELESEEYDGDRLKKKQMAEVERRVNANFKNIKFRLFEKQINGGEADTCQLLIGGVLYGRGANKAAEINAQLEIIEFLQKGLGLSLPVFIDNTESVNDLREIPTQTIALRVTTDPTITVVNS